MDSFVSYDPDNIDNEPTPHHPHWIQVYGVLYESPTITMSNPRPMGLTVEYMSGGSLHDVIHNGYNGDNFDYDIFRVLSWTKQAASALNYLHESGIMHRDVKPRRMLLNNDFTVLKLSDLYLSTDFKPLQTAVKGTLLYMAPEVMSFEDEVAYDEKCDVYSLGISIWEMYHRKYPPGGLSFILVFVESVKEGTRPEISASCDPEMADLIRGCWSPDPKQRPSMRDIHSTCVRLITEYEQNQLNQQNQLQQAPPKQPICLALPCDEKMEQAVQKWRCLWNSLTVRGSAVSLRRTSAQVEQFCYSQVKIEGFLGEGNQAAERRVSIDSHEFAIKIYRGSDWAEMCNELEIVLKFSHHRNLMRIRGVLYSSQRDREKLMLPIGYVMDLMSGGSLDKVIHGSGEYSLERIFAWSGQAASALRHLHTNNIIHRDVKPVNMLLDREHRVLKLGDLGTSTIAQTLGTATKGTFSYMAPEIISYDDRRMKYNNKVDVYSLSISIWEMYHRKKPFDGNENVMQLAKLICDGGRPQFVSECDSELRDLVVRGWSAEVDDRPSMEDIHGFTQRRLADIEKTGPQLCLP